MAITNGYLTASEVKQYLNIEADDVDEESLLEVAVEAASRSIDEYCDRVFYDAGSATARTFVAHAPRKIRLPDFSTTAGLVVKTDTSDNGTFDTTWDASDYRADPLDPENGRPYTAVVAVGDSSFPRSVRGRATIEVTAQWGWAAVPPEVKHACAIQAGVLFKRATEGASPIVTMEGITLPSSRYMDAQAQLLLNPLRKTVAVSA